MAVARNDDAGKLVLRILLGGILLCHGYFKLTHGVEWIRQPLAQWGLPGALSYGTYVAELLAPILLIIGYQVRLAALVIAFDMLMAFTLVVRHRMFSLTPGGGWAVETEAMILFIAVALVFLGGGRYGVSRS